MKREREEYIRHISMLRVINVLGWHGWVPHRLAATDSFQIFP